jgi:Arc/MetJ-type ribon-helix-helix transcriptional regulator
VYNSDTLAAPDIHVHFPRKLYESINDLVVKGGHYKNAPEFIVECTRQELDEIEQRKIIIYWHRLRTESRSLLIPIVTAIGSGKTF